VGVWLHHARCSVARRHLLLASILKRTHSPFVFAFWGLLIYTGSKIEAAQDVPYTFSLVRASVLDGRDFRQNGRLGGRMSG
jgi:hypothetical protein